MSEVNTETSVDSGIPEVHFALEVAATVQAPVDDTLSISGMAADAKAVADAIDGTKAELQAAIDDVADDLSAVYGALFPVGCIYASTSSTAPTFGGTNWRWREIKVPATWGDLEDGFRSFAYVGTSDTPGTVHFWLRIADAEG